jgi:hypothetical protein
MVAKLVHAFTNNSTYKAGLQPGVRGASGCTAPTTNLQNIKAKYAEQPAKTCYTLSRPRVTSGWKQWKHIHVRYFIPAFLATQEQHRHNE